MDYDTKKVTTANADWRTARWFDFEQILMDHFKIAVYRMSKLQGKGRPSEILLFIEELVRDCKIQDRMVSSLSPILV